MKCLVVDDDTETCAFLQAALAPFGHEVVVAHAGRAALDRLGAEPFDAVVLDRMLPGELDGLEVLRQLRAAGAMVPVLVLSALGDVNERVHGLRAGADDYLGKPFAVPELVARLESLVRRQAQLADTLVLRAGDLEFDTRTQRVTRAGQRINLQPREIRLLEFFLRHQGRVLTRGMLLEGVWEYHFDPQTNVIDVQISRLRTKLDLPGAAPLIHTVRGEGYLFKAGTAHA
ncbi:MAG: response regulator transcription factor [Telluria sp.]